MSAYTREHLRCRYQLGGRANDRRLSGLGCVLSLNLDLVQLCLQISLLFDAVNTPFEVVFDA